MYGIGERLKLARKMARLSQQDLAELVGVSKMAISKYENAQMMPGSDVLFELAEKLGVSMEFLLRQAPELTFVPRFRTTGIMQQKAEDALLAAIQEWLERYLIIEGFFPADDREYFTRPNNSRYLVESLDDAEIAAAELREAWALGIGPIENMTELLEARGIKVGLVKGDEEFVACTFEVNEDMPVIASNEIGPGDRQRFGLAHELGHLVMDVAADLAEKAADRFAGAFLVSRDAAYWELGNSRNTLNPKELYVLKFRYGMSMAAWIHRATELDILDKEDADKLWQLFRQRGWKRTEPAEQLPIEKPSRMHRLVWRLVAEDVISRSRANELLDNRIDIITKKEEEAFEMHG